MFSNFVLFESTSHFQTQFFITSAPCDFLDQKHVVFGKVLDSDGLLVMRKIENVPTGPNNRPKLTVKVTGSSSSLSSFLCSQFMIVDSSLDDLVWALLSFRVW